MRERIVAAVVVFAAVVGCSREGPKPSASTSAPQVSIAIASPGATGSAQKRTFVDAANKACREYSKQDEALPDPDPDSPDDYVPFMKAFIKIGDDLQAKLRALPVPPEDAAGVEKYLDGNDQQAMVLKQALPKIEAAVRADDAEKAGELLDGALDKFNAISESQDPFARRYGLVDCANPEDSDEVGA
jgi:hypothetical protein